MRRGLLARCSALLAALLRRVTRVFDRWAGRDAEAFAELALRFPGAPEHWLRDVAALAADQPDLQRVGVEAPQTPPRDRSERMPPSDPRREAAVPLQPKPSRRAAFRFLPPDRRMHDETVAEVPRQRSNEEPPKRRSRLLFLPPDRRAPREASALADLATDAAPPSSKSEDATPLAARPVTRSSAALAPNLRARPSARHAVPVSAVPPARNRDAGEPARDIRPAVIVPEGAHEAASRPMPDVPAAKPRLRKRLARIVAALAPPQRRIMTTAAAAKRTAGSVVPFPARAARLAREEAPLPFPPVDGRPQPASAAARRAAPATGRSMPSGAAIDRWPALPETSVPDAPMEPPRLDALRREQELGQWSA